MGIVGCLFSQDGGCVTQSLAKLTVNFQSSLSICDSASEAANNTGNAGDSCNLQQYCDTGCQTDIMGEVGASVHVQTAGNIRKSLQNPEP